MVDQTNIARAQVLIARRQTYRQAIAILDESGIIRAFVIESEGSTLPDRSRPTRQTWVDAEGITTPPQMLDSIKHQIEDRLNEVEKELGELGITGLDTGPPFPEGSGGRAAPHPAMRGAHL